MKIYESLYVLEKINETFTQLLKVMIDANFHQKREEDWNAQDKVHYMALYQFILMDATSYQTEYYHYFGVKTEPEFKERILQVKQSVEPVMSKIKNWDGIQDMRNQIIAHNPRSKTGDFHFFKLGTYNTPRTFGDLLYLKTCLQIVQTAINKEFNSECIHVWPYIQNNLRIGRPPKSSENFEEEIIDFIETVNQSLIELGKPYKILTEEILKIS